MSDKEYIKGRGAQINPHNRFLKNEVARVHEEGLDIGPEYGSIPTQVFKEHANKLVNYVDSPDISAEYSMNPYQGCEHGCIYCYARNTHEYWGFSAGKDFESKIIVKENAVELLRKFLSRKNHRPSPIMLSGNTDCYQPLEKKFKLTRGLLETLYEFRHPVGIITKNGLIRRDIDILKKMAEKNLVKVNISLTTLNADLHHKLEPRTASPKLRLKTIRELNEAGIPTGIMLAPIIPGLNDEEIPAIMKVAAQNGAVGANFTMLRLNGAVSKIFEDWVKKNYPNKAKKVMNATAKVHGGQVNDSRFGTRMRGTGELAQIIRKLFESQKQRYFKKPSEKLNCTLFRIPQPGQMRLFE